MSNPLPWNSNQPYYPGNVVVYAVTNWLATAVNRGKRPDLYPDIWTNQGGSGGGGGGGVTAVTVQGAGLLNVGTASNVILKNTGAVNITSGNPATLSVSGPDASYNFTLTNLAPAPFVAGYGIGISGDVISNTGVASLVGGTNATVTGPAAGNVYTINNTATGTLTPGTGISIASGVISNTGVISIVGASNSTSATNNGGGSFTIATLTQQNAAKYITGAVNANVNVPNTSSFTTLATITVPLVSGIRMTNEYAGIAFSCLVSMFGPTGGGNMIVRLYANDITPSPAGIYPLSGVPTNYSYFAFAIADNTTFPVAINFLMSAGTGAAGSFTQYTASTTQFNLEAAILNVSGSESATWNPSGTATYQLVGIN